MVDARLLSILRKIIAGLENREVNWAIGGSLGLALRGATIQPRDIDILTDKTGAYEIERIFSSFTTRGVTLRTSDDIRSHFGSLEMDGVKIEIMGDFQLRGTNRTWDDPLDLKSVTQIVKFRDLTIPVVSLQAALQTYSRLGRDDRARTVSQFLEKTRPAVL